MYKGPESYNTPPNPDIWGDEKKRGRNNFAEAAYGAPTNTDNSDLALADETADAEARIAGAEKRAAAAETEQVRLADLLSGDFEVADNPTSLPKQSDVDGADIFGPDSKQNSTIEKLYDGTREGNLAHVVNPGPQTPRPETVRTPDINMREVTVDGETKTKPAKTLWQRLLFG